MKINNITIDTDELNKLHQAAEEQHNKQMAHFKTTADGKIKKKSYQNVAAVFATDENLSELFRHNSFTDTDELYKNLDVFRLKPNDLDKADTQVLSYIERKYDVCFDDNFYQKGKRNYLQNQSYTHEYNPVKDHINAEEWDEKPRAASMFIDVLGAADTPLNRDICLKWLVGTVGRAFDAGLKLELMPILVGEQGRGKSTLCSALCPKDDSGQALYFLDNLPSMSSDNKDNYQLIHNNWIVEIGELDAMNKSRIEATKSFVSQTTDQYRKPYDKAAYSHARMNSFIGTTNSEDFLRDRTGNRRWLPVHIDEQERKLDVFNLDEHYIHQVLAEALVYYKKGVKPVIDPELTDELKAVQSNYMAADVEEERIKLFADMLVPKNWDNYTHYQKQLYYTRVKDQNSYIDRNGNAISDDYLEQNERFTTDELITAIFQDSRNSGKKARKVSSVMQTMPEFEKKTFKANGGRARGYVRIK